jgi:hypothetical protein
MDAVLHLLRIPSSISLRCIWYLQRFINEAKRGIDTRINLGTQARTALES